MTMDQDTRRGRMSIWAFVALLCLAPDAFADTKIYCDNKCGDTRTCQFICCHVTARPISGVDSVANVSCSSSGCCAHPEGFTLGAGGSLAIPGNLLEPIAGKVKAALCCQPARGRIADRDRRRLQGKDNDARRHGAIGRAAKHG